MVRFVYQGNSALVALIILCCLFFTHPFCKASGSECFTHEGSPVTTDFPCDPTQTESYCCGAGWVCLPNRLCAFPGSKEFGRGSCTDKLWASTSQCPSFCLDTPNSRNGGLGVIPCEDPNTYCCDYDIRCNCTTGRGTISLSGGFAPSAMIKSANLGASSQSIVTVTATQSTKETEARTETVTETVSRSASPSISSLYTTETASKSTELSSTNTLSTADSPSNGTSKASPEFTEGIKIGVAVGVSLAALIMAFIGIFAFWRERRLKKQMEELKSRWIPVEWRTLDRQ